MCKSRKQYGTCLLYHELPVCLSVCQARETVVAAAVQAGLRVVLEHQEVLQLGCAGVKIDMLDQACSIHE